MRFIKNLPNDYCKASLYMFNNKYVIQFEAGLLEQVYKVSEMDVTGQEEVEEIITPEFMEKVIKRFQDMANDFGAMLN